MVDINVLRNNALPSEEKITKFIEDNNLIDPINPDSLMIPLNDGVVVVFVPALLRYYIRFRGKDVSFINYNLPGSIDSEYIRLSDVLPAKRLIELSINNIIIQEKDIDALGELRPGEKLVVDFFRMLKEVDLGATIVSLQKDIDFFTLGKSIRDSEIEKFFIDLGVKISENSFRAIGEIYSIEYAIKGDNIKFMIKKNNSIIFEITGKSDNIKIITKDSKLFIELNNIQKLQDVEKFESRIYYNADGADKLSDLLYIIKKYTSLKKIYYFNQLNTS